ncbi:MAG TPA: class I SAM-dependent methyltransferase [Acidimicrobiia bacterium]|nr:class I SAM-dependent methyltransferase [Acidimicrobiia bacterium]
MTIETKTADALSQRLFAATVDAMDMLTVYVGDRLGYYRALAELGPQSSSELAERAGTTERYTREWLEQQTITGIVEVDDVSAPSEQRRYSISPGHAEALTDGLSLAYITPFVRMVAAAGFQVPHIVEAHRQGNGVSWAQYGLDMREAQGDMNRPFFAGLLGQEWFPSVPDLHERLSDGARVADIGFGHGWSAIALATAYPGITVDGFDVDEPSVETANQNAKAEGVADRVKFHAVDAAGVAPSERYDVVTAFECIHDLPHPVAVLSSMRTLAGGDGIVVVMDEKVADAFGAIGDDIERVMYGFSNLICLPDGMAHPESAATGTVMREGQLAAYARDAGFSGVDVLPIESDLWRFYRLT